MFSVINATIACLWLASAGIDYSEYCYLWQLKEYRVDRLRDFFSTKVGQSYWKRYSIAWRSALALIALLWPVNSVLVLKYALITVFAIDALRGLRAINERRLQRPVFTAKAIVVIGASLLIEAGAFLFTRDWSLIFLLLILRFFIISLVVQALWLPTNLLKRWYIYRASVALKRYPKLVVIGVTGSYGKTSVKTFLGQILGSKFRVVTTPKHVNTEIGVARFILSQALRGAEIFVVEMGAYREGEIKKIARMVQPTIGILTAINAQHAALFGGIAKIQQAKYELLRALPKNGLAVVNSDNSYCRAYLSELSARAVTFGTESEQHPTFFIQSAESGESGITFAGVLRDRPVRFSAPLIGAHNAMNLAACILVGGHLGMTEAEIIGALALVSMPERTLKIHHYGISTVIDDSYNSNPDGFLAALDVLSSFSSERRRVVITRGIIELGAESKTIHERLGGAIAYVADELILITRDFEESLRRGVGPSYKLEIVVKDSATLLLAYVRSLKEKNCVILLESRLPEVVYNELIGL